MTEQDIKNKFKNFNKLKVLIIGDVMIDSYLMGKVERISPEAPVPIVSVNKRENRLGGAANVAINVHSLGAEAILCSVIGDDSKSEEFFELLKDLHLSNEAILKSKNRKTSVKFRVIGNNSQMLRVDEETVQDLTTKETTSLLNLITKIISSTKIDIIIFEDYDKGVITPFLIENVVKLAKKHKISIAADPKKNNFLLYKNIDLFKPNLKELKEGLKIELSEVSEKKIHAAVEQFQYKQNIKNILITLSEKGVFISSAKLKNKSCLVPAHIRNIADVSGAGDTVISVASLLLSMGVDPVEMAAIANIAGGIVCEHLGAVAINKEQLLNEVIQYICKKTII